ncbi:MAG TPA: CesT family type III secretion system chaperone [Chlamydiales bacterium]|nr:CesT family type III secretion system chaperone [Chlamydiales bacterium]
MSFHDLIYQLSEKFGTELAVDSNGACQFIVDNTIALQLEPDPSEEHLLVASPIFELPPGKFRQEVLEAALAANANPVPPLATLCYSQQTSALILFAYLSMKNLHIDALSDYLSHFLAIALDWKNALDVGQTSPIKTYMTKDQNIDLST